MSDLSNIDLIIKELNKKVEKVIRIRKIDGITVECSVKSGSKSDTGIKEINKICKELKLLPISTEKNKDKENIFALQFPELVPEYSETEIEDMYKLNFKWLLDNINSNDATITKHLIEENKEIFLKQSITMYYRSNVNQYKERLDDYLNNYDYRNKIEKLFNRYLDEYYSRSV